MRQNNGWEKHSNTVLKIVLNLSSFTGRKLSKRSWKNIKRGCDMPYFSDSSSCIGNHRDPLANWVVAIKNMIG